MKMIKDLFMFTARNEALGICLSGGGAFGFAHIGVLQSLEEHGIYPRQVAGSSMGAIIGVLYAAGYTPAEMLKMIETEKLYKITKLMTFYPTLPKSGLSNNMAIRELIRKLIPHNSFEQLEKKFSLCVSNLEKSEWEIISSGNNLDEWIAASSSIPGFFETVKVGEMHYVDGGVLNNLPAQALEDTCHTIIGIDVMPHSVRGNLKKPVDTFVSAVRSIQHQNAKEGRDLCSFLIEPQTIETYHEFSFEAYKTIYKRGYLATNKYIAENPSILKLSNNKSQTKKNTKQKTIP